MAYHKFKAYLKFSKYAALTDAKVSPWDWHNYPAQC